MALFSAANNFRMLVVALPALLNGVGLTVLSAQIVAGRAGGYRGLFWTILIATAGLAAGGSLIVLVAGGILLGAFGDAFRSAYPILVPLCAAAVLESLAIAVAQLVQTEGRMWKILFGVALPRDVGLVVITKAVVAPLGARGLALAHLCSCVVAAVGVTCLALLARRRVNAW